MGRYSVAAARARGAALTSSKKSAVSPLTGKLFDESGQNLTQSHAVKGERRYRYYVSRNLINGTKESERGGWRLPAPEIERTIGSAAYTILSDQAVIANAALATGLPEHQLPSLFSLAANWMKHLRSDVEISAALSALVDRVDLIDAGIRVSLKPARTLAERGRPTYTGVGIGESKRKSRFTSARSRRPSDT